MDKKICNKCKVEKSINNFYKDRTSKSGYSNFCKVCKCNIEKENYKKDPKKYKKRYKNWIKNNPQLKKDIDKQYRIKNKKRLNDYNIKYYYEILKKDNHWKENHNKKTREWQLKNKTKTLIHQKRSNNKARLIPHKKLARNLSTSLWGCLKNKDNKYGTKKTLQIIGLKSWDEFKIYIESTWLKGMNWENWGIGKNNTTWHIDHKIPSSSAKNEEEVKKLFHYTNLRAYWGSDNIRKSNK